jgi:anti-sigma factor RsiW
MTAQPRTAAACRKVLLDLSRALDGDLPRGRCTQIERHVESCADCRRAAAALRASLAACRRRTPSRLPASVRSRARQRIKALLDR